METTTQNESLELPSPTPHARSNPVLACLARAFRSWQFRYVVAPLAISRLALMVVAWIAMHFLQHVPKSPAWEIGRHGQITPVEKYVSVVGYPLINMWSRWDAGWYYQIASSGYQFKPGEQSNAAFFPAYPLLIRAVHALVGSQRPVWWFLCGIVASNAALVIAMIYLFLLTRLEFDEETAGRAVLYFLIFPTTLFLSAVYSESLFLVFMIGSFYHARKREWWRAGILGCAATFTRAPGIVILVGLGVEYLLQCGFDWRKVRWNILALALVPLGLAAFMLYLQRLTGTATAPVQAQFGWGLQPQNPLRTLLPFFRIGHDIKGTRVDLAFTLAFIGLVIATVVRLRASYAAYSVAALIFITMWGSLESIPRYVIGIFPAVILLALLGRDEVFHRVYVPFSAGLAVLFMAIFAVYGWVA